MHAHWACSCRRSIKLLAAPANASIESHAPDLRFAENVELIPRVAASVSIFICLFLVPVDGSAAEQITLRLHTFSSPNAIAVTEFLEPWARQLETGSNGRVTVQLFPAMQLGGRPADLYGQARDGVVDIVWTLPGYTPGRFPLTEVFELPFVCSDAEAASQALTAFHEKWMQDEYRDTQPLVFHTTAPGHIHSIDRQIRALEDFEGLKVRVASQNDAAMLEAFGAIPVGMPITQTYEALSRGVVDGAWIQWSVLRPYRLHETTRYHTEISLVCSPFVLTMNKARYDGLPDDIRQLLDETTGIALARRLGRLWQEDENRGRDLATQRGNRILTLAESERTRLRTATAPLTERWIDRIDALGYDGQALLDDARSLIDRYSGDRSQ